MDSDDDRFDGMMVADGFDNAVIGVTSLPNGPNVLVYDKSQVINILVNRDGMTMKEAEELITFRIRYTYSGNDSPLFVVPIEQYLV
jgi:hypothetical protein